VRSFAVHQTMLATAVPLGHHCTEELYEDSEVVTTVQSTEREASGSNSDEVYGAASFA
jgi:hypothetical protein